MERVLGTPALFATAYGNVGSSIYYALGLTAVYALGLTLYELIAGRPAFEGDELMQILRKQLSEAPPELRERATVSDGTAAIVARALEKHAPERFADAAELLDAIELVRNGRARPLRAASADSRITRSMTPMPSGPRSVKSPRNHSRELPAAQRSSASVSPAARRAARSSSR